MRGFRSHFLFSRCGVSAKSASFANVDLLLFHEQFFNLLGFSYHMECLRPAVEYVPLEEWFCPACASRVNDQEEQQEEEHRVREAPRARATRGRPRGSTARRVSGSDRTGVVFC